MSTCSLCPRKCGVDRAIKEGFCRVKDKVIISLSCLHKWEEPCIVGSNGSGTIFFSGCNLKCCYCQNYEISSCSNGKVYDTQQLVELFKEIEKSGATNINLVTPTHFIKQLIDAFEVYKPKIPIVYNSSGYESVESLKLVDKYIDVYLVDFKYYDNELAFDLSKAKDYREVAISAIEFMCNSKTDIIENDVLKQGVIIRHLILPNHIYNSFQVLNCIKERFPNRLVSLMAQYVPMGKAKEMKDLNRKITKKEYEKVVDKFISLELNGYIQEMESADKCFIPNFK